MSKVLTNTKSPKYGRNIVLHICISWPTIVLTHGLIFPALEEVA